MRIAQELFIDAPLTRVWPVITDPAQAVAALPGATLHEVDGDVFRGVIGITLGPMSLNYAGEGKLSHNASSHEVVIEGRGTDERGSGGVSAMITARLAELPDHRTRIVVDIDLELTGKPGQFGRGILGGVVRRLAATFVRRLEEIVNEPGSTHSPVQVNTHEPFGSARVPGSALSALRPYLPAAALAGVLVASLVLRRRLRTSPAPRIIAMIVSEPQQATELIHHSRSGTDYIVHH